MSRASQGSVELIEKPSAGWFGGVNSVRTRWLVPDDQAVWAENAVCRGGIWQTRPGNKLVYTVPEGNFQGKFLFKPTKAEASNPNKWYHVFAVNGNIYAILVGTSRPLDTLEAWEPYRLKNISFSSTQPYIAWVSAEKNVVSSDSGTISIIPTYSVLMIQDNVTACGFWDGQLSGHLDEQAKQTPTGLWMRYAGGRLWIARSNTVVACDLLDPLSAIERVEGSGRGDFRFSDTVTALAVSNGESRQSNLVVYTNQDTSSLQASILDRESWATTSNFQNLLYSNLGCSSGRSPIQHAGLLWWHSQSGLVNSDSATASFLTSQIKYRDVEMAYTKRMLSPDLSGVCTCSFEDFLLVSVPADDVYNRHTMSLDYSVANELNGAANPAWCGVWTGTRPIEWATAIIDGQKRCFHGSVDYFALPGETSTNHIWESFQSDHVDTYDIMDEFNAISVISNPIYCTVETKLLGDGMDLKKFRYAELDLVEIGNEVNMRVSYGTTRGGYNEIMRKKIIATLNDGSSSSEQLEEILSLVMVRPQSRRVRTTDLRSVAGSCDGIESQYDTSIDKAFSLFIQWCGRCGVEALRIFMQPYLEPSTGSCEKNESGIQVVTEMGTPFKLS